jgi:hypothetical protein
MRRRGRKSAKLATPVFLDRRAFLRASTAVAAPFVFGCQAAPIAAPSVTPAPALVPPPPPPIPADAIKVGIVGCGGRGTGAALNALLAKDGQVYLTSAGDVFADRMDSSLKELETPGEGPPAVDLSSASVRRLPEGGRAGVDVVILSTPPHFRPVT